LRKAATGRRALWLTGRRALWLKWTIPWGLLRHYWVLTKFLLTVVTIIVLLQQMEGIGYMAKVAAETTLSSTDLLGLRRSLSTHATGGLFVLLVLAALSIFKPRGMTRYGWRKQREQGA
jgi:hypothetical protein